MVLQIAVGRQPAQNCTLRNTPAGRAKLVERLHKLAAASDAERIVMAYEASGQGFGLHDALTQAGIECHVLAPTRIARSLRHGRSKTDQRDTEQMLQLLRGHVLAGNPLPDVWVPDPQTRADRDLVRMRLDLTGKQTRVKTQIRSLLKRNGVERPDGKTGWTQAYRAWLDRLAGDAVECRGMLAESGRAALASLLRQFAFVEQEISLLENQLHALAKTPRLRPLVEQLTKLHGVGLLTALVFVTELGCMKRFTNRRQLTAYLGLAPSAFESGQSDDRKGHITRQGPSRVRRLLCQTMWVRLMRHHASQDTALFDRVLSRNRKHRKIAVVAGMRKLAIQMWHAARRVETLHGATAPPMDDPPAAHRGEGPEAPVPSPRTPHPLPSSLCRCGQAGG